MNRRTVLLTACCAAFPGLGHSQEPAAPHPLDPSWNAWKAAYLATDGRVVDTLQHGASHSESQGYGLLLAATMGDAPAFDSIDRWTMSNLSIRPDSLLAWRWLPADPVGVPDRNNASDGDLFYIWALLRAAATLDRPELLQRATNMARDLSTACILAHPDQGGRLLFAPAAAGFQRDGGLIVNFSYYMPLAMRAIALATGISAFATCAADGEAMLVELAEVGLIPDWIEVRVEGMVPAADLSDHNGYEALRVPLFLIWSGQSMHPAVIRQADALAAAALPSPQTATVMERWTSAVLESSPDAGYAAISALSACVTNNSLGSAVPLFSVSQPYYPATLHLMTLLAIIEASPECVPT